MRPGPQGERDVLRLSVWSRAKTHRVYSAPSGLFRKCSKDNRQDVSGLIVSCVSVSVLQECVSV